MSTESQEGGQLELTVVPKLTPEQAAMLRNERAGRSLSERALRFSGSA